MSSNTDEVGHRKGLLREMLQDEADAQGIAARKWDAIVELIFYSAIMSGILAVLAGLVSSSSILREVIGLAAAFGVSSVLLAQEARCRRRAERCRAAQDLAQEMVHRLDYEMWEPVTADALAALSAEWRKRRNLIEPPRGEQVVLGKLPRLLAQRMLAPLRS